VGYRLPAASGDSSIVAGEEVDGCAAANSRGSRLPRASAPATNGHWPGGSRRSSRLGPVAYDLCASLSGETGRRLRARSSRATGVASRAEFHARPPGPRGRGKPWRSYVAPRASSHTVPSWRQAIDSPPFLGPRVFLFIRFHGDPRFHSAGLPRQTLQSAVVLDAGATELVFSRP